MVSDSGGRVWFSLNRGISVVDPARLRNNSAPAIAHIQSILADGRPVPLQGTVHIPGGQKRITFGYTALSLSIPERVRFRYQLQGFDQAWSQPISAREAVYTALSPRSYRFRIIASNPDGVWSGEEAAITFRVDPLLWQTWWFRLSLVMACAAAVAGLYRFRLHQMTTQLQVRFEERLAERTRIAQELHDTLLQGFLSASMQVHVAMDQLPADSREAPAMSRALELMRQVIEEGRNAVRGLRSAKAESPDLENAFSRIQNELAPREASRDEIDFRVIVEGQPRPLHPVLRDEVYRIGREALINAFRHARGKKIVLELEYSSSSLRILVRDNGRGIDPQFLRSGRPGHWGLSGMRERAERIGGRLRVWSALGAGTEIELSVPGHVAFQDQPRHKFPWIGKRFVQKPADPEPGADR